MISIEYITGYCSISSVYNTVNCIDHIRIVFILNKNANVVYTINKLCEYKAHWYICYLFSILTSKVMKKKRYAQAIWCNIINHAPRPTYSILNSNLKKNKYIFFLRIQILFLTHIHLFLWNCKENKNHMFYFPQLSFLASRI